MKKDEILYELNDKPLGDEAGITGELFETDEPGYMYILLSANGSYYVGSKKYLKLRIKLHSDGIGAKYSINQYNWYISKNLIKFKTHLIGNNKFKIGQELKKKI